MDGAQADMMPAGMFKGVIIGLFVDIILKILQFLFRIVSFH